MDDIVVNFFGKSETAMAIVGFKPTEVRRSYVFLVLEVL